MYRYNETVKVWLFWDTGSDHFPLPMFISLGCASGNKPGLGVMETLCIPHNHTLTVYYSIYHTVAEQCHNIESFESVLTHRICTFLFRMTIAISLGGSVLKVAYRPKDKVTRQGEPPVGMLIRYLMQM